MASFSSAGSSSDQAYHPIIMQKLSIQAQPGGPHSPVDPPETWNPMGGQSPDLSNDLSRSLRGAASQTPRRR
ncbi:hypothetical protein CRENBAI_026267 [Crenichthys baileyi]|uniref:Uncharacterized protein n=1 Tax=Crenichthys baileyi TaxID=28760 RepID=A0AAV9S2S9_9TELE